MCSKPQGPKRQYIHKTTNPGPRGRRVPSRHAPPPWPKICGHRGAFCVNQTFVFLQIWSLGIGPSGRFLFLILFSWLLLLVIGLRLAESNPCLLTHVVIRNRPFGPIPFLIIFSWLLLLIQGLLSGRIYACLWLQ